MRWLAATWREVWGLFIDDARLALFSLTWVFVLWLVFSRLHSDMLNTRVGAAALFFGIAAILIESALRAARRPRP